LAAACLDIKVFGGSHGLRQALGQGKLVFGSDFGEHGFFRKKGILTLYQKQAFLQATHSMRLLARDNIKPFLKV
jgi:hypothetical protein